MKTKSLQYRLAVGAGAILGGTAMLLAITLGPAIGRSFSSQSAKAQGIHVQDHYGVNGYVIWLPFRTTGNENVPFVTDALLDGAGHPAPGIPISFTLTGPNNTNVHWIQKTDSEGRVRGTIYAVAFQGTGNYSISATGTGIPNPGTPYTMYVGDRSMNSVDVAQGATTAQETFQYNHNDTNYLVTCTANYNAYCWITNKTTSGFTINLSAAAPASAKVEYSLNQ